MSDAQDITRALGGKWYGRYGRACCPACNGSNRRNPSLSISDGASGALLLWCFKGCAFAEVLSHLKKNGALHGHGNYRPPSADELRRHAAEIEADAEKRAAQARRCWQEARPITGTLAEAYLRNRGITCALPGTLRFHPDCWHASAKRCPAMVATVEGARRFAMHRTYLCEESASKADITPNKAMLGSVKGGAVRLAPGSGPLVVAEGIETALSLASGLLRRRGAVWAALSAPGMSALDLPPTPHELVIATDGDAPGWQAGNTLAERASALGWQVSLLPAPDGRDWNDMLRKSGAAT